MLYLTPSPSVSLSVPLHLPHPPESPATCERERKESEEGMREGMREILLRYAVRQDDGITERNQTKYHLGFIIIPTLVLSFESAHGCGSPSPPVRLISHFTFSDPYSNPSNFSTSSTYAYAYTYATVPAFKAEFKSMWGIGIGGREPSALSSLSAQPIQSQLQSQSQAQSYSSLLPLPEFLTSQE
ncbi:hypothetical protein C8J55DRAFT_556473 [Lentinula edodes]|uniref:Uncharacterized protein n=1 Tax=Lentinula lateritia TaxID=40482 RepID=A0A9W9DZ44_9AGAR|nr:hypothetical protein C8J55DRAFT_556473 [Lentinula edodes]